MPTDPLTVSPATPAALNTRHTAAGVKDDRRSPSGPGLDTGEDRRILTTAGTTPKTTPDHRHNAAIRARRRPASYRPGTPALENAAVAAGGDWLGLVPLLAPDPAPG